MATVIWMPVADNDLLDIWCYYASKSPAVADRICHKITKRCERVAEFPESGSPRFELGRGLRSFRVGDYLIFYQPIRNGIEVLRILHGARDIPPIFE